MERRKKIAAMQKEKSAGAVIFRIKEEKKYYLLLHCQSGHWDFPKGHIEKGESEEEAARREIQEETGIANVDFISGFEERINYFFKKNKNEDKKRHLISKEVVFFLAKTSQKEISLSFEHINYNWLPYQEALGKLIFKNAREILKEANDFLKIRPLTK